MNLSFSGLQLANSVCFDFRLVCYSLSSPPQLMLAAQALFMSVYLQKFYLCPRQLLEVMQPFVSLCFVFLCVCVMVVWFVASANLSEPNPDPDLKYTWTAE